MAICLQNIVWLCIAVVAVLLAVELTRWHARRDMHRTCRAICQPDAAPATAASTPASPPPALPQQQFSPPSFAPVAQLPIRAPPLLPPFNQITHGRLSEWAYVGYAFPKTGFKPGEGRRFPLFARSNIYQKYGFDYYVVDDSRNHVRINIDLAPGVKELQTGDEIKITGETGKWIVNVDIPADRTWQAYLPAPGFPVSWV
jgi:hypothetical protein